MPLSTRILRLVLGATLLGIVTSFLATTATTATTERVWSFDALFGWIVLVVPGVAMSWVVMAPAFLLRKSGKEGEPSPYRPSSLEHSPLSRRAGGG